MLVPMAIVTLLALGVAAGALVVGQSGGSDQKPVTGRGNGGDSTRGKKDPTKNDPTTQSTDTKPPPQRVSYKNYAPPGGGWSAEIPTGQGWSAPVDSQPNAGKLYRTTIDGPAGLAVVIDYTPDEVPQFGAGSTSQREVTQPAFGSATEYVFSGGDITQCQGSTCVDYIINDDRGGGYGVLAGGGSDFALAKQVGNRVMRTLQYNDY
jgi:hypothetical protein